MTLAHLSGADVLAALQDMGYCHDRTRSEHTVLKYTHPHTGEQRTVSVPRHDWLTPGTLRSIAEQCGATDPDAWTTAIAEQRGATDADDGTAVVDAQR